MLHHLECRVIVCGYFVLTLISGANFPPKVIRYSDVLMEGTARAVQY